MSKYKDCGIIHITDNDYFCPECQIKYEKRTEFRALMDKLDAIVNLDHFEASYMSGYSYAEMESFSLILRKLQKRFHFPIEKKDFVNSYAKKEAEGLFEDQYPEYKIRQKIETKGYQKIKKQIEDHEKVKDIDSLMGEIIDIIFETIFKEEE